MNPERPANFGEYKVLRKIGTGGFGAVYLAENPLFPNHLFAVKAFNKIEDDTEATNNFLDELHNVIGLSHSNIVQVRGFGMDTQGDYKQPYIVMDFIEGPTGGSYNLKQHIRASGGKLDPTEVKRLFKQILGAMAIVHDKRVAHLDLKPENILLNSDFVAFVSDFGVSRTVSSKSIHLKEGPNIQGFSPYYASPEQIRHAYGSRHSDIFSLGVMLMECLTGTRPEVVHSQSLPKIDYTPPSTAGLDRAWDDLLNHCLSIDPAYRYPNASVMLRALQRVPTQDRGVHSMTSGVVVESATEPIPVAPSPRKPKLVLEGKTDAVPHPGATGSIARLLEMTTDQLDDEEEAADSDPRNSETLPRRLPPFLSAGAVLVGLLGGGLFGLMVGDRLGRIYSRQLGDLAGMIVGSGVGGWIGAAMGKVFGVVVGGFLGGILCWLLFLAIFRVFRNFLSRDQDIELDHN
jgi:serine/threonine protein kinase